MNRKLNLFAAAIVLTGGLTLARPAQATMAALPDFKLRACCSTADQKQFCCFEGGDGCRITAAGCTRV
ncbi:hypothetical protein [Longimicrobium sp.]|jgi:hypothetical protein|uniref:hypothetical protein n=1 Tax=Longimicrobium sp. TaxID=2029185 RepID=UPI002F94EE09